MAIVADFPTRAISLRWPLSDDQFAELCGLNPDMRFEYTSRGDLIVMPPTGGDTGHTNANLTTDFTIWSRPDGSGLVFDSSTLFVLPHGSRRSPDVAWIRRDRWEELSPEARRGFAPICPDFVLELRSPSDNLGAFQDKMQEYLDNGVRLGWLIDPGERVVYVYRPQEAVERLEAPGEISGEPVLPGFELRLGSIWSSGNP